MHDIDHPSNILDKKVVESPDLLGKECLTCGKVLAYAFFRRDSSYKDGRRDQCTECESAPRLSTAEHVSRLRELNYYSQAVKKQRWANQSDYEDSTARLGRPMHSSDLIRTLHRLVPSLYIMDGNIEGDLAVFQTYPCGQPDLEGRSFRYLFYFPLGVLPEFSQYEFDSRDVLVRESKRGWRTVLLRLIKTGLLTEATCDRVFGKAALGPASTVWNRQLYSIRNRK